MRRTVLAISPNLAVRSPLDPSDNATTRTKKFLRVSVSPWRLGLCPRSAPPPNEVTPVRTARCAPDGAPWFPGRGRRTLGGCGRAIPRGERRFFLSGVRPRRVGAAGGGSAGLHDARPLCWRGPRRHARARRCVRASPRVELEKLAPRFWRVRKVPPFRRDFEHFAYVLQHPDGVVLFDAPPVATPAAFEALQALGEPRVLVVSHAISSGSPGTGPTRSRSRRGWARANRPCRATVSCPMSGSAGPSASPPIPRSSIRSPVTRRDRSRSTGRARPPARSSCSGDAVCVVDGGAEAIVAIAQVPPAGDAIQELLARPIAWLAACTGVLRDPAEVLGRLRIAPSPCAQPWRGDDGGVRARVSSELTWARAATPRGQ